MTAHLFATILLAGQTKPFSPIGKWTFDEPTWREFAHLEDKPIPKYLKRQVVLKFNKNGFVDYFGIPRVAKWTATGNAVSTDSTQPKSSWELMFSPKRDEKDGADATYSPNDGRLRFTFRDDAKTKANPLVLIRIK